MSDARYPRHASRPRRALSFALPIGLAVTALGAMWALADVPAPTVAATPPTPAAAAQLPGVQLSVVPAADPCAEPAVTDAIAAGDDEAVVAAFGGGAAFRDAVVVGNAPCISLLDPARTWVVVNKTHELNPTDYVPVGLIASPIQQTTSSRMIHQGAAAALGDMAADLEQSGSGVLGMNNAYRSYLLQVSNYTGLVSAEGQRTADLGSARPGFSEHQTGLAVDVVACSRGCGEIASFGGTPESEWIAAHAWEYGFVVRYEAGATPTTGYEPEPWHLRYIGPALAEAYHAGGFHTLEEFFGLPAAPDYVH